MDFFLYDCAMTKVKCPCSLLWRWDQSLPFVIDPQKVSACNFYYIADMTIIVVQTPKWKTTNDLSLQKSVNPTIIIHLRITWFKTYLLQYNISILVEPYPSTSKNSMAAQLRILETGEECIVLISHIWSFALSSLSLDLWGFITFFILIRK